MPYIGGRIFDRYGFWLNGLIYTIFIVIGLFIAVRLPKDEPITETEAAEAAAPSAQLGRATAPAGHDASTLPWSSGPIRRVHWRLCPSTKACA